VDTSFGVVNPEPSLDFKEKFWLSSYLSINHADLKDRSNGTCCGISSSLALGRGIRAI
jgi:hypothetical protein